MAKTKMVDGRELTASDFAFVGNPDDPETWKLPVHDEGHARAALGRFNQTDMPADAKAATARKIVAACKKFGIDASGFMEEHKAMMAASSWFAVSQAAQFLAEEGAGAEEGYVWPVQIIEAGRAQGSLVDGDGKSAGKTPHVFTEEVVAQFAAAANGARFGRRHPAALESDDDPARIAGWFSEGVVAGKAARAKLHLLKNEQALRDKLLAAKDAGQLGLFGLSVLAYVAFQRGKHDDLDALVSERLGKLISVDLVTEAGAGGKFLVAASKSLAAGLRELVESDEVKNQAAADAQTAAETAALKAQEAAAAAAAAARAAEANAKRALPVTNRQENGAAPTARGGRNMGGAMKERILKVLETLRKFDSGRADELSAEFNALPEEQHVEFLGKVKEALDSVDEAQRTRGAEAATALEKRLAKAIREDKLIEAKLPAEAANLVREHLDGLGRVYTEAEIDAEIKRVRTAFASFSNVGRVTEGSGITVGRDSREKVQLAMDAMLGVKEARADKSVRAFRGIREAYGWITGDHELTFGNGGFGRVSEAIATADFPNILLNSLTKKLLEDYTELGMGGLELLISPADISDYKTQDRVRMGYLGDLATVAEAGAYLEITKPTDEKIQYAVGKRGGLLTISEETIRNDDTGKIRQFPNRLARAARRTLKQFITDFFVNNPNFDPDTLAWFVAGHSNLGSTAFSDVELDAREIALMKQTEKDSTKRLGLPLEWIMIPVDLKSAAYQVNNNNDGANSWYHRFGMNETKPERIIVNELLTDANDWFGGCLPQTAPFLEIGFLDGRQEPQILLANDPQTGLAFTNDQVVYKAKFVFGGDITDYRPVFKNVVP